MNSRTARRRLTLAGAVVVIGAVAAAIAVAGDDDASPRATQTPPDTQTTTTTAPAASTTAPAPSTTASTAPPTTATRAAPQTEPRPGSAPALAGPPDQTSRPSAKKMARVGGFLNDFWGEQFARGLYANRAWQPVRTLRIGDHPLRCGGKEYEASPSHVFCGPDYFVGLAVQDYDELRGEGDDTPTPRRYTPELSMWIAHEWAHAAQWSGGTTQRPVMERELEADCMAGAFLAHVRRHRLLPPEEYDLKIVEGELRSAGDDFSPPPPGDEHGTGDQRWAAFSRGWNAGPSDCLDGFG